MKLILFQKKNDRIYCELYSTWKYNGQMLLFATKENYEVFVKIFQRTLREHGGLRSHVHFKTFVVRPLYFLFLLPFKLLSVSWLDYDGANIYKQHGGCYIMAGKICPNKTVVIGRVYIRRRLNRLRR